MVRAYRHPWRAAGHCALFIMLAAFAVSFTTPATAEARSSSRLDRTERAVVRELNEVRRAHGLPRLHVNRALARAANSHCSDMLRANFFAHASSNGTSMAARVRRFKPARRLGETLAYVPRGSRSSVAQYVVSMWMNSPGHRAVILTRGFRRVGVARQRGALGANRVSVFTADFSSVR
jgi:uncharacterized protein YkwD